MRYDPHAGLKAFNSLPGSHDLPGKFMPEERRRHHEVVPSAVGFCVRPASRRNSHPDEEFPGSWFGDGQLAKLKLTRSEE